MKRNIFFLFFLIFFTNCFALQNKNNFVDISSSVGVMFGRASEYVYLDYENFQGIENYNEKLSQLDYDYAVPCLNLKIESRLFKYLHLGFDISTAIPMKCGIMQDYDWLNVQYYPNSEHRNALTNYSIHDNQLNSYLDLNFSCGAYFQLPCKVALIPFVGLSYDFISFTAKNGYGKYGNSKTGYVTPISEEYDTINYDGPVIKYRQYSSNKNGGECPSLNFGLKFLIEAIPNLKISGAFLFLPFYTISSFDYHIRRNIDFLSVVNKSFKFDGNLRIVYKLNNVLSLGLDGKFSVIPEKCGVTYTKFHSEKNYSFEHNTQSRIARISGQVSFVLGLSF